MLCRFPQAAEEAQLAFGLVYHTFRVKSHRRSVSLESEDVYSKDFLDVCLKRLPFQMPTGLATPAELFRLILGIRHQVSSIT